MRHIRAIANRPALAGSKVVSDNLDIPILLGFSLLLALGMSLPYLGKADTAAR